MCHERSHHTHSRSSWSFDTRPERIEGTYYGNSPNFLEVSGLDVSTKWGREEARRTFRDLMFKNSASQPQATTPGYLTRGGQETNNILFVSIAQGLTFLMGQVAKSGVHQELVGSPCLRDSG